jgi:hypothetical protein
MRPKDKLRAYWSKRGRDIMLDFPLGRNTQSDGHWLSSVFDKEFEAEITKRGYDIKTLRFSVDPMHGNDKFASQQAEVAEGK